MIGKTNSSLTKDDILLHHKEADIIGYYFGIKRIPCIINSPLRKDDKPSLGLYSPDGERVNYIDFATNERGSSFKLLKNYFGYSNLVQVYKRVAEDLSLNKNVEIKKSIKKVKVNKGTGVVSLEVKVREWKDYDIKYWENYGVTLNWLKWADVYPISHKFITKDGKRYCFSADKYAYAFKENKEGKLTLKIYQPFNKKGFKWANNHDGSVIALWTKMPEKGKEVVITSSVKDALCFMCNMRIPAIALQGEAYPISGTAIRELCKRFTNIYVILDNDKPGLKDAQNLCEKTGFINVVIPPFEGGKDISDYYKCFGKEAFINLFKELIPKAKQKWNEEFPF